MADGNGTTGASKNPAFSKFISTKSIFKTRSMEDKEAKLKSGDGGIHQSSV